MHREPPRLGEPLFAPGGKRRLLLLLMIFAFLVAAKYLYAKHVGHTYLEDPTCVREHFPACQPMINPPK